MGHHIVVVGGGPWSTYAMERLAALLTSSPPSAAVVVTVFERTGLFGPGATHSDEQVPTSYLNRVASQLSFASDESSTVTTTLLPEARRRTFVEWATERHRATGDPRFALGPTDVPHRYLHGMALRESFAGYVELLRSVPGVTVELVADEVVDVVDHTEPAPDRADVAEDGLAAPSMTVCCRSGRAVQADRLLLVTGQPGQSPESDERSSAFAQHAREHPDARYLPNVYPLDRSLTEDALPRGSAVGVLGLGLTAIDLLLHLTEGRGGRFEEEPGGWLRYRASGREPRQLVAVSPSGMFPASRAENVKADDGSGREHRSREHHGVFLTAASVEGLRAAQGRPATVGGRTVRQLDFARHVFPVVALEMAVVYYGTLLGDEFGREVVDAATPAWRAFLRSAPEEGVAGADMLLAPVDARFLAAADHPTPAQRGAFDRVRGAAHPGGESPHGHAAQLVHHRLDWRRLFDPLDPGAAWTPARWRDALVRYMRADLMAAAQGNLDNPVKAACDGVWRDLRSTLCAVIDRGGLTAPSHASLGPVHLRYYTRMSNGTGMVPMNKILALVRSGIVDVSVGPQPQVEPVEGAGRFRMLGTVTGAEREVDTLVEGRAHGFHAAHDPNPLYPALLRRGFVRLWRNPGADGEADFVPGALDIDEGFHPRDAAGTARRHVTVLGSPVEGVVNFQLAAARPHSDSSVLRNIARWAADAVSDLPTRPHSPRA